MRIPPGRPSRAHERRTEFDRSVDERSSALLRTAYLLAGELAEAEDLVQECLLMVARRWPRVRRMDHPHAYARRILVNLALHGGTARSPAGASSTPQRAPRRSRWPTMARRAPSSTSTPVTS